MFRVVIFIIFIFAGLIGFVFYKEGQSEPLTQFPEDKAKELKSEFDSWGRLEALLPSVYAFAPMEMAKDHGKVIDLEKENKLVSEFINSHPNRENIEALIVPGFMPPFGGPMKMNHSLAKRINHSVVVGAKERYPIFILSGGNVKPRGTPYNEAFEMKKHLMKVRNVPEFLIAIEPYAQNTVTNLRNVGRFLLTHKIFGARIISTYVHNMYIGYSQWTSFRLRARQILDYNLGEIQNINDWETSYHPSENVLQKSQDKLDP